MIPLKFRKIINDDPYFSKCAREAEGKCSGRITIEHAWLYSGKQINEMWNYVPLCWYHHLGKGLDKDFNRWIAVMKGWKEAEIKYPKHNWRQEKKYLDKKFLC